jgi:hypothetical protein
MRLISVNHTTKGHLLFKTRKQNILKKSKRKLLMSDKNERKENEINLPTMYLR